MKSFQSILLLAALPMVALAQSEKDMIRGLQRDITALQEQLRAMQQTQSTQNERLTAINENVRSAFDVTTRLSQSMGSLETTVRERLGDISKQVSQPLSGVGTKVDSMADQFSGLSNSVADLNSRIAKLDAKVVELQKMLQAMPAPTATPPPNSTPPPQGNGGSGGTAASNVPPADRLYTDAQRDFSGGNYELALQGFREYLKAYGDTQLAADAQFYIAEIHARRDNFEEAVKSYDAVIQTYPDSSRVPNARYMKGVALVKIGRRSDAAREFKVVTDKFPSHELAPKARDYLKALGVATTQAPGSKKTSTRRR